MRSAMGPDIFEELKAMGAGARLGDIDGSMVFLDPGEAVGRFEELFVKRDFGAIADARTGEIVWPVEDE